MAEINNDEKRITVSGEQIEEVVEKMPAVEADVKANKQSISALQATSAQNTSDIAKNTADIELKANADNVYSREETDNAITAKVAEIVAGAPEEFDTLKEMSDWLTEHSDSAATMNTAIQANTKAIEGNTADIEQNKSDILNAEKAIEINRLTLGTQITKNILKLGTINPTNGLTVTVNSNKSITINGTSTNYNAITLMKGLKLSLDKRYTMSISDIATGMYVFIGDVKQENTYQHTNTTTTIMPKVEINNVWLYSEPGTKFNNVTLYPMIRSADIVDPTYEPYVPSINERLTETKNDIVINRATLGTQCKNIINKKISSETKAGVTITVNDDKSITFNGTTTGTIYYWVYGVNIQASNQKPLSKGRYILTGCPKGGAGNTYNLVAGYRQSPTADRYAAYDYGDGCNFEIKADTGSVDIVIQILPNTVVDNLTFYPMLRPADITDSTYEPYKPSLQEQINALIERITALETAQTTTE